jgi:hypothetical protein
VPCGPGALVDATPVRASANRGSGSVQMDADPVMGFETDVQARSLVDFSERKTPRMQHAPKLGIAAKAAVISQPSRESLIAEACVKDTSPPRLAKQYHGPDVV